MPNSLIKIRASAPRHVRGFNLVEVAIALMIVSLALGTGLMALSSQSEAQKVRDTQKGLDELREALIGFALANGRLPCPASATSNGRESPVGGGACSNPYDGFVPAVTLGLPNNDGAGYVTDAWSAVAGNRIRYAVTTANSNAVTTTDGIKNATMALLGPDLSVCASSTGITATTCGVTVTNQLTNNAIAVLTSVGKYTTPRGGDETANTNNDRVFVMHTLSEVPGNSFDDTLTWLAPGTLFNRMIQAGRLP